MNVVMIRGSARPDGFSADAERVVGDRLRQRGAAVTSVRLAEADIAECRGCFQCLRTGDCPQKDDVDGIIAAMRDTDGLVMISPVRNGLPTACYKRFYERITYRVGFALALEGKHVLAISSVGYAGGKSVNRRTLGLEDMGARLSTYLFFRTGIPGREVTPDMQARLESATERLLGDIRENPSRPMFTRVKAAVDRAVMRRVMFTKHPEQYAHIIDRWREKGYM